METPLVSVCMTTYNHEAYLAQAIESVLAQQTSFGVELVVGEDCSTDHTREICKRYVTQYPDRVRLVCGPENVGWRANYLRTFEACRGKYVAYCDGDDWWSDTKKLQKQVDLMEQDSSCGMCFTRAEDFYQESGFHEIYPKQTATDFDSLLLQTSIPNCTTLARRELIVRYYSEIHPDRHPEWGTDDWPMWLWFSATSKLCCMPIFTAIHRRLPASVSHEADLKRRIAFRDSLMEISLWFDARYTHGRNHFRIERQRSSVALWTLAHDGTVDDYVHRWWCDIRRTPRLLLCPEITGLLIKKRWLERKKQIQ